MKPFILSGLEKTLNTCLNLDPEISQQLTPFENKVIALEITDWNTHFLIQINHQQFSLLTKDAAKPDTHIKGKLFSLIQTACQKKHYPSANSIEISGDLELGKQLQTIFSSIHIDWEEHLATLTGDIIAHQTGSALRYAADAGLHALTGLAINIKEFLQQESRLLITTSELNSFIKEVATLQNDVERLSARLDLLTQRTQNHDTN